MVFRGKPVATAQQNKTKQENATCVFRKTQEEEESFVNLPLNPFVTNGFFSSDGPQEKHSMIFHQTVILLNGGYQ